jgi:hypothetical protein
MLSLFSEQSLSDSNFPGAAETYRSLIASDLSWRTLDIVQGQTLRWLVEVFIQDWKSYEAGAS